MSKSNDLKLVVSEPEAEPAPPRRTWIAGLVFLFTAGAATWLGADSARRPPDPVELAGKALQDSIDKGARDPAVLARLRALREELAREPLDSVTRTVYAGLLLSLSRSLEEAAAAAFHASAAAELAPVTVPVQRRAARILARCGDLEAAFRLTRRTFLFDPAAGAGILEKLLPICGWERAVEGVPDTPGGWVAWSRVLEKRDRRKEAEERMNEALRRWPQDPEVLLYHAARAWPAGDTEKMRSLFPEDLALPEDPDYALLFAFQGIGRAAAGDRAGMERSLKTALDLLPRNPSVLQAAGDAWILMQEPAAAVRLWKRGLYFAGKDSPPPVRIGLLLRLARMEEKEGRPARALDHWREILLLAPDHREARGRVDDLTGFRR